MIKALPTLAQQEGLIVGEGAALPARVRIKSLPEEKLPRSESVSFAQGWAEQRLTDDELAGIAVRMST